MLVASKSRRLQYLFALPVFVRPEMAHGYTFRG